MYTYRFVAKSTSTAMPIRPASPEAQTSGMLTVPTSAESGMPLSKMRTRPGRFGDEHSAVRKECDIPRKLEPGLDDGLNDGRRERPSSRRLQAGHQADRQGERQAGAKGCDDGGGRA